MLRTGSLTAAWVPDTQQEAVRELVRTRQNMTKQWSTVAEVKNFRERLRGLETPVPAPYWWDAPGAIVSPPTEPNISGKSL